MRLYIPIIIVVLLFSSCHLSYNEVLKTTDYDYKYEAAKEYYVAGQYSKAFEILEEVVMPLKGTEKAEESLFMLGLCYFNLRDYETSVLYFDRYVKSYSKGEYTEAARFYSGKASYLESPDPRLDQTPTYNAISKLQEYLDFYPYSERKSEVNDMIFNLQDRLIQKEYLAAKLYYNLGSYNGNCTNGGSNYEACIITAENALKAYPYTTLREEFFIMILRARYYLASHSVEEKLDLRFRETVEEYYGFKNEFPESKYMKEAENIYKRASHRVKAGEKDLN